VKIERERLGSRPLWALIVEMQFLSAQQEMEDALQCAANSR